MSSPKYATEPLSLCWDDYIELCKAHWQETMMFRHGQTMKPDKDRYLHFNKIGFHVLYTIRIDNKLIGACGMYVTPSMHTGTMMANEDTIFIQPEYRKGWIAYKFMKFIQDDLVNNRKVGEIMQTTPYDKEASFKLLERMGFKKVAFQWSKQYEENL